MRSKLIFILLISICFILPKISFSQEDLLFNIEQIIEEIADSYNENNTESEQLDYSEFFSTLESFYYDPINLNTATVDELSQLIFLTDFQIYSIINYRKKYGNYISIYEVQNIDGIDYQTIKYLLPFVYVGDENSSSSNMPKFKNMFKYGKNTLITRYQQQLQTPEGYQITEQDILDGNATNRYLGDPSKLYLKYNYSYKKDLSIGLTAEKDPGEQFFQGAQKYGFDFYSAHIQLNNVKWFKKIIVGDYSAQFGQGLTLWTGLSYGKTSSIAGVIKNARGINKYTSTNEAKFFRGEAVTVAFGDFSFTEFFSYKKVDANLLSSSDTSVFSAEEDVINAFEEDGYHRTLKEVAAMNNIGELITGGNLRWNGKFVKLGLTGYYSHYSANLQLSDDAYKLYNFSGNSNINGGLDYLISLKQVNIFGETSLSQNLGWATLNGAVINFVPEFKMSVVQRYFSPEYQSLYSSPFSEGNKSYNESGLYVGAEFYPIKKWRLDVYVDAFKFPWLKYGIDAPSTGIEYALQLNYFTRRDLDMYIKFKYETKENNVTLDSERKILFYSTSKIRYHLNFTPNDQLKFKSRIELAYYNKSDSAQWGYMIAQTIQYKPKKLPLNFSLHLAVFDTQYETRLYSYEPDVLYGFSVPSYNGQGYRVAFVVKYQILRQLAFWFRISNTYYANKDSLSSSLNMINSNNQSEVKLQLKYTF